MLERKHKMYTCTQVEYEEGIIRDLIHIELTLYTALEGAVTLIHVTRQSLLVHIESFTRRLHLS